MKKKYTHVATKTPKGLVSLVGAGPGNPDLLTLKAVEKLKVAEVVLYDRLIDKKILHHAKKALLIPVGKRLGANSTVRQERIIHLMIRYSLMGKKVVRLKGGDPFVFGRGGEELLALAESKIPFDVVPGVSSFYAAPEMAGIPITHRGISNGFAVFTAKSKIEKNLEGNENILTVDWHLASKIPTLIFLMGVANLSLIVNSLLDNGRSPKTPIAIISRATYKDEIIIVGTLGNILSKKIKVSPPSTIVVGEVVKIRKELFSKKRLKIKIEENLKKIL